MKKVSVIIPVFNVQDYLEECLNSVINQTLEDIEIICINDASTDDSYKILEEYEKQDERIIILENEINRGLSYTRNRGLNIANSEYVYFLDSDDLIEITMLEDLYFEAKQNRLNIIYFDAQIVYMTEKLKDSFIGYHSTRNGIYDGVYNGGDLFVKFIQNDDLAMSVCRQFYELKFLKEIGIRFHEEMLYEDNFFTVYAILKAEKVSCINKQYFKRRFRENSIMTNQVTMKNVEGMFNNYYELLKFWEIERLENPIEIHLSILLNSLFKRAKYYYSLVPHDKREIPIFLNEDYKNNLLYNSILSEKNNCVLLDKIDSEKLNMISKAKKVIIYGAGVIGRDVLSILDSREIPVYAFAVTNLVNNPVSILRVPVREIADFNQEEKDAIVIVAVSKVYEESVITSLINLGFCNYLKI